MKIRISGIIIFCIFAYQSWHNVYSSPPQNVLENIQQELQKIIEIAKPSVVTISSKTSHSYTISKDNGFLSFFRESKEEKTVSYKSICSGLVYNAEGFIITKSNYINEYEDINVILNDGTQCKPIYIGRDQKTGITVLKIEPENAIQPPAITTAEEISVGSLTAIIGNSMGISPSVSFGMVTSILKNGLIQLSAMVSPGNSGSPVFDIKGNVIGIMAAQVDLGKNSRRNIFTDVGVAFPIQQTCEIADEIIKSYKEDAGWIGIQLQTDDSLKIVNVIPHSPAEKAGLKTGDILVKYNNVMLSNPLQLGELIKKTEPGSTIPIYFMRENLRFNVFITISKKKPFCDEQDFIIKTGTEGYYFRAYHSFKKNNGAEDIQYLQNRIRNLETELTQLKTILNKQQQLK